MSRVYYFISDLHVGGDEALGVCDFEDELVAFLEYRTIEKPAERELSLLQRAIASSRRRPVPADPIPKRTVLDL